MSYVIYHPRGGGHGVNFLSHVEPRTYSDDLADALEYGTYDEANAVADLSQQEVVVRKDILV